MSRSVIVAPGPNRKKMRPVKFCGVHTSLMLVVGVSYLSKPVPYSGKMRAGARGRKKRNSWKEFFWGFGGLFIFQSPTTLHECVTSKILD